MKEMAVLSIGDIRIDGGTQARAGINDEAVADYVEAINGGEELRGLRRDPFAIAYIKRVGELFAIRIDWGVSVSETRRPIPARWIDAQLEALGFDADGVNWMRSGNLRDEQRGGARGGYVYFLQAEQGGLIKIGKADNPASRVATIRRMSPVPLRILAITPGGYELEQKLHRRFAESRAHGEWFCPTSELLSLIKECAK